MTTLEMMDPEFRGKRVTVMGLGGFGGGAGVTRWLADQGATVLVTDLRPPERLAAGLDAIADLINRDAVSTRLGEHRVDDFRNADLIVANPAVPRPWDNTYIAAARDAGVPVTTEIGLLVERLNRRRVIGVTGSAGKSTTASMIHHVLERADVTSHLGGNLGGSLLNRLDRIGNDDWVVLELSSAMLYWLGDRSGDDAGGTPALPAVGWSPHIALLTNVEPNHLDWHGTFEHYRECKENILRFQQTDDHAVRADHVAATSTTIPLRIPGRHNQHNAATALAAASIAIGDSADELAPLLADFAGLPHRLQCIGEFDGCPAYNDSKSTTPRATVLAVAAFDDPSRVHLIAGGYDKGSVLAPIAQLADSIAGLYTIGATGPTLAFASRVRSAAAHVVECGTIDRAIETARSRMNPGDVLLLSPGCASWDQFENYERRGERFIELIQPVGSVV